MKFRINEVQELIEVLSESSFESIAVDEGDFVVEVRRSSLSDSASIPLQVMPDSSSPITVEQSTEQKCETASPVAPVTCPIDGQQIRSQLVGRVSLCDEVGVSYVSQGQEVAAGHTLCTINSLKQAHPIAAVCGGIVVEISVSDGDIVEYGQVLMTLEGVR